MPGCLVLLVGLPLLLYYGYCWGLWGRSSLLLQYLFQCNCPPASEDTRFPKEVDVIISACRQARVRISPSGRLLYAREEKSGISTTYLLDLQTMDRIDETTQPFSSFLTDDLWLVENGLDNYVVDRITGAQYPIQKFVYSRPDAQINGETNLPLLVESLRQAKEVFLTGASQDTVIALASDFRTYPERNFITDRFDIPGFGTKRMERFLEENNINYKTILPDFPHEVVSPNGTLIARDDGIYLVGTNQLIAKAPPSLVRGWTYDGHGVIYAAVSRCLFQVGIPFADDTTCFRRVPQPVLKLKVPSEYLSAAQTP